MDTGNYSASLVEKLEIVSLDPVLNAFIQDNIPEKKLCKLDGCDKPVEINRLVCSMHRGRKARLGTYDASPLRNALPHKLSNIQKDFLVAECSACGGWVEIIPRNTGTWNGFACKVGKAKRAKAKEIERKYKITLQEYEQWFENADGKCELCGSTFRLALDHDHITGKIRGVLCFDCNTAIGKLGDNIGGLERALSYLRERS